MSADAASAALQAVWQVMVEIAEAANDQVVNTQVIASKDAAGDLGAKATDLSALAQAAAVLARRLAAAP